MSRLCPSCQREIEDDAKFCPYCAAYTEQSDEAAAAKPRTLRNIIIIAAALVLIVGTVLAVFTFDVFGLFNKHEELKGGGQALFTMGMTPVSKDGKWGYIDNKGEFVIKPQFSAAMRFNDKLNALGAAAVDGKFGFLNSDGEFVISPQFLKVGSFSSGGTVYTLDTSGNYSYIDSAGRKMFGDVITDNQRYATDFNDEGYALVSPSAEVDDKCRVIKRDGSTVYETPDQNTHICRLYRDMFTVMHSDGDNVYMTLHSCADGGQISDTHYDRIDFYGDYVLEFTIDSDNEYLCYKVAFEKAADGGLVPTEKSYYAPLEFYPKSDGLVLYTSADENAKRVLLDGELNELLTEGEGQTITSYLDKSGIFCVKEKDGTFSAYSAEGKLFNTPYPFGKFNCGLAPYLDEGGRIGYIDTAGNVIMQPKYTYATEFSADGYAYVKESRTYAIIDTEGKELISGLDFAYNKAYYCDVDMQGYDLNDFYGHRNDVALMQNGVVEVDCTPNEDVVQLPKFDNVNLAYLSDGNAAGRYDYENGMIEFFCSSENEEDDDLLYFIQSEQQNVLYPYSKIPEESTIMAGFTDAGFYTDDTVNEYGSMVDRYSNSVFLFNDGMAYYIDRAGRGGLMIFGRYSPSRDRWLIEVYDSDFERIMAYDAEFTSQDVFGQTSCSFNVIQDRIVSSYYEPSDSKKVQNEFYDVLSGKKLNYDKPIFSPESEYVSNFSELLIQEELPPDYPDDPFYEPTWEYKYKGMRSLTGALYADGVRVRTSAGHIPVKNPDGTYGYGDMYGNITGSYVLASAFNECGYAVAKKADGNYCCLDSDLNEVFSTEYEFYAPKYGYAVYYDKVKGRLGYLDMEGKPVGEAEFVAASDFYCDGYAVVKTPLDGAGSSTFIIGRDIKPAEDCGTFKDAGYVYNISPLNISDSGTDDGLYTEYDFRTVNEHYKDYAEEENGFFKCGLYTAGEYYDMRLIDKYGTLISPDTLPDVDDIADKLDSIVLAQVSELSDGSYGLRWKSYLNDGDIVTDLSGNILLPNADELKGMKCFEYSDFSDLKSITKEMSILGNGDIMAQVSNVTVTYHPDGSLAPLTKLIDNDEEIMYSIKEDLGRCCSMIYSEGESMALGLFTYDGKLIYSVKYRDMDDYYEYYDRTIETPYLYGDRYMYFINGYSGEGVLLDLVSGEVLCTGKFGLEVINNIDNTILVTASKESYESGSTVDISVIYDGKVTYSDRAYDLPLSISVTDSQLVTVDGDLNSYAVNAVTGKKYEYEIPNGHQESIFNDKDGIYYIVDESGKPGSKSSAYRLTNDLKLSKTDVETYENNLISAISKCDIGEGVYAVPHLADDEDEPPYIILENADGEQISDLKFAQVHEFKYDGLGMGRIDTTTYRDYVMLRSDGSTAAKMQWMPYGIFLSYVTGFYEAIYSDKIKETEYPIIYCGFNGSDGANYAMNNDMFIQ